MRMVLIVAVAAAATAQGDDALMKRADVAKALKATQQMKLVAPYDERVAALMAPAP